MSHSGNAIVFEGYIVVKQLKFICTYQHLPSHIDPVNPYLQAHFPCFRQVPPGAQGLLAQGR